MRCQGCVQAFKRMGELWRRSGGGRPAAQESDWRRQLAAASQSARMGGLLGCPPAGMSSLEEQRAGFVGSQQSSVVLLVQ